MPWNKECPAFRKYTDAERNLMNNGFKYAFGDSALLGIRFDHPDWIAVVKWNAPQRFEVYVYKRKIYH